MEQATFIIQAGRLLITLGSNGQIQRLEDSLTYREYQAVERSSPFISLYGEQMLWLPVKVENRGDHLLFTFERGMSITLSTRQESNYTVFEAVEVQTAETDVEALFWGPFATSIDCQVGEVIGVACDASFAIGLQTLNTKTQGGWPYAMTHLIDADAKPDATFSHGMPGSIPLHLQAGTLRSWGSTLQAFTLDATRPRIRTVGQYPDNEISVAQVPAFNGEDAQLKGSRIALFGCGTTDGKPGVLHKEIRTAVLSVIGELELQEGLAHPMIEGEWQKTSDLTTAPYFILSDLAPENIKACCAYAKEAGIRYLYRDGLFFSDGHYRFNEDFNGSDAEMKALVQEAARDGIRTGIHTMTGFIEGADLYVTPRPDKRLLSAGSAPLLSSITETETTLHVANAALFLGGRGREARLGDELITYTQAQPQGDGSVLLQGCLRGSFSTTACSHETGCPVLRMWPDAYGGLHCGLDLVDEVSGRLADIFNTTGVRQVSFDGSEDLYLIGLDAYAHSRFMDHFWFSVKDHENLINDGSRLTHHNWHMASRMNWGEPWGEAMREGQMALRYRNQALFNRNFFPRMLGWFLLKEDSPLVDIEWALAKSAGFDAGYALVSSSAILEKNPFSPDILSAVKRWEEARQAKAFPYPLRLLLCQPELDWHLEDISPKQVSAEKWTLHCLTPGHEKVYPLSKGAGDPWEPVEMIIEEKKAKRTEKHFLQDCISKTHLIFDREDMWVESGWSRLQESLAHAIHVAEEDDVAQEQIDMAVDRLTTARGQMVRRTPR